MKRKYSRNELRQARLRLSAEIKAIPKENKQKFSRDLVKLIELAQKDDYESFKI